MMGRVLKAKGWDRTSYVVSSKAFFGSRPNAGPNQKGLSRKHLVEACHEALQRLQLDYLDLFFCHRPDRNVPIEEVVWTMNTLIQQDKILYWGTSEWTAQEIMEAHAMAERYRLIGPAMEQPEYNMFNREKMERDYLTIFSSMGLGTTIWSPLAAGLLTGKYNQGTPPDSRMALQGFDWLAKKQLNDERLGKTRQLVALAAELGVPLAQLAIAWTIHNPHVTTAILGATRPEQLHQNLGSLDVLPLLTPDVMERIESILQNKPVLQQW
jgi:voltage-dependent potassium channel beta subunit